MQRLSETYSAQGALVDHIDGLSVDFPDWRFNLRPSNTEPLLRLNLETRADPQLLSEKTAELRHAASQSD